MLDEAERQVVDAIRQDTLGRRLTEQAAPFIRAARHSLQRHRTNEAFERGDHMPDGTVVRPHSGTTSRNCAEAQAWEQRIAKHLRLD